MKNNRPVRTSSLESKCTVDSTASSTGPEPIKPKRIVSVEKPTHNRDKSEKMQTLLQRYRNTVDRSNSVRQPESKSVIPRRSTSLRKTDSQNSVITKRNNPVERSNSRTSLVSSRSSLNSATSTNTVKKMPLKNLNTSKAIPANRIVSNTVRKPNLVMQQPKTGVTIKRIPSGGTLSNHRPPLKSSGPAFMKPTTSSTTKTHTPTITPTGRLLQYRSTTLK